MPLTDDFSYKLGDNGVILNPDSLVPPFVDITVVRGFDSAPIRTTERDHEGTDGGFMDAIYEKGRPVSLEGMAYASGHQVESFLDTLKGNWAPSRTLVPLYFKKPGVEERMLLVKPLGVNYDVDEMRRVGSTLVRFSAFAEDPRIYTSAIQMPSVQSVPAVFSGREYNKGYNYGYGDPVTPNTVNMRNNGNRPTPVIFSITGPATFPTIINDRIGLNMVFDITVPLGSVLEIDTQYNTVRLDGANRRSTLLEPNWFMLEPGDNFIRYRATGAGSSASILTGRYYDAWR